MNEEVCAQLDMILEGRSLQDMVPVFAGYLANMGVFGLVPKEVMKDYVWEVIDKHYALHEIGKTERLQ